MGVLIGVEYIGDPELTDREDPPIGRMRASQLIGDTLEGLALAAAVDGLAHERPRQAKVRLICPDLVRIAAREAGNAKRIVKAEALIAYSGEVDRLFRRNVTGDSGEVAL